MMGNVTLVEALELTALVAKRDPGRRSRFTARWLSRWLTETPAAALEDAAIVVAYLGSLGGPRHAQAVATLRRIIERGQAAALAFSATCDEASGMSKIAFGHPLQGADLRHQEKKEEVEAFFHGYF
jgi:hypothetical protein